MKIAIFLYLIDVLPHIACFLKVIAILLFFFLFIGMSIYIVMKVDGDIDNEGYNFFDRNFKKMIAFCLCLFILGILIPSRQFMYMAGGLYLGNEALENPKVKALVGKSYKILDDKLDEILNSLSHINKKDK